MDLDAIEAGVDFAEAISAVDSCAVLIALIGPKWLTITDEDDQRRLDNPDDYVRFEILCTGALRRHSGARRWGASAPRRQQLPPTFKKLHGSTRWR